MKVRSYIFIRATWSSYLHYLWPRTLETQGRVICVKFILFFNFFFFFYLISWQTTVPCAATDGFCCPLVVTMMPSPKDRLEKLVQASCSMGEQGRPIHIGAPGSVHSCP